MRSTAGDSSAKPPGPDAGEEVEEDVRGPRVQAFDRLLGWWVVGLDGSAETGRDLLREGPDRQCGGPGDRVGPPVVFGGREERGHRDRGDVPRVHPGDGDATGRQSQHPLDANVVAVEPRIGQDLLEPRGPQYGPPGGGPGDGVLDLPRPVTGRQPARTLLGQQHDVGSGVECDEAGHLVGCLANVRPHQVDRVHAVEGSGPGCRIVPGEGCFRAGPGRPLPDDDPGVLPQAGNHLTPGLAARAGHQNRPVHSPSPSRTIALPVNDVPACSNASSASGTRSMPSNIADS